MSKIFVDWAHHFAANDWTNSPELPWDAPLLAESKRRLIAPALAQFQLGEYAEGRSLQARAAAFASALAIAGLAESTRSFIREEQRHSLVLGRFLTREGVKLLQRNGVDSIFRRLRRLAGFELIVTVLSTAECIAVPYYSAVRDFAGSELLERICRGILRDEAVHLRYQGQVLALFSRDRGFWTESAVRTLHRLLLLGTGCVVYAQHAGFFRAAGTTLDHFLTAAFQALAQIEMAILCARSRAYGSLSCYAE